MASKEKNIVLVRTYSAGVHFGELAERAGKEVTLKNVRRIWSWKGANSLNEIATAGCAVGSRISVPVEENVLTEAIEVIKMSPKAVAQIDSLGWQK
jgi:hypothetical protein